MGYRFLLLILFSFLSCYSSNDVIFLDTVSYDYQDNLIRSYHNNRVRLYSINRDSLVFTFNHKVISATYALFSSPEQKAEFNGSIYVIDSLIVLKDVQPWLSNYEVISFHVQYSKPYI